MHLAIKETIFTPSVKIHPDEHKIEVSGQSRLEDPSSFYEKLLIILEDNINEIKSHLSIDFMLSYMNSSSSKWLFHILKGIQNKNNGKKLITINWYFEYDYESILEAGEAFQSLLNIPFNIIESGR
jgi:hypothetical protein